MVTMENHSPPPGCFAVASEAHSSAPDVPPPLCLQETHVSERALFTEFWNKEATTTRNVISRIPEGSDYRPDPKSRTAKDIAWQIVCEEKMIIDALGERGGEGGRAAPAGRRGAG